MGSDADTEGVRRVVVRSGTRSELAGVTVGSGNVWSRPGHDGRLSVSLALPDDSTVIVAVGDAVTLDGVSCTLEAIEDLGDGRGHDLCFRVGDVPAGDGGSAEPVAPPRTLPVRRPGAPALLRQRTHEVMAVLGVPIAPAEGDAWERTEREHWVEIDRAQVGPNTDTSWSLRPANLGDGAERRSAVVHEAVVRWNPDEIHRVSVRAHWTDGEVHVHASVAADTGEFDVTGPEHVVGAVREILARPAD